jgi:hypothetical protein
MLKHDDGIPHCLKEKGLDLFSTEITANHRFGSKLMEILVIDALGGK